MLEDFLGNQQEFSENFVNAAEDLARDIIDFATNTEFIEEIRPNTGEQIKEVVEDECSICVTYFIYPTESTIREWKVCYNKPDCQRSDESIPMPPPNPRDDRFEEEVEYSPPSLPSVFEYPYPPDRFPGWTKLDYIYRNPQGVSLTTTSMFQPFTIRQDNFPTGEAIPMQMEFFNPIGIGTERQEFVTPCFRGTTRFWVYRQYVVARGARYPGFQRQMSNDFRRWVISFGSVTIRAASPFRCWQVVGHSGGEALNWTSSLALPLSNFVWDNAQSIPRRPPQPPEEINMNCCDQVNLRLRRLQDDMTILMRWTGARPGQMKVPKTFLKPDGLPETFIDKIKDLFGFNEQTIRSIPEFLNWQMERLQEYMGEWPIESRSPNGGKLNIPNIAMASQALLDKAIAEGEMNQMIGAASAKSLLEVGLARENIALIVSQLEAIIDFLDMEVTERQQDINHGFTLPDADNSELPSVDVQNLDTPQELSDFLVESVRPMKVIELSSNQASFGDLRLAVDKIKALLSPVTVSKDDTPAQIKAKLKPEEEENNSPDFVNWTTIETQSGEPTPWGDSPNERPDINSLPPIS